MNLRLIVCLLLTLACTGCASLRSLPPDCIKIGPAGAFCPLPPSALPAVQASHLVTVTQTDQKHTFLGRLGVDAQALRLAGASLFGTHLFTITWDGHAVTSQPPIPKMHPQLVVAMLEVALADPAVLRPRLHGMKLTVDQTGDTDIRELHEHGHLVARIERRGTPLAAAHLVIHIPPAHLTLRLEPLQDAKGTQQAPGPAGIGDPSSRLHCRMRKARSKLRGRTDGNKVPDTHNPLTSFRRRPESIFRACHTIKFESIPLRLKWIPAFAGMTLRQKGGCMQGPEVFSGQQWTFAGMTR